jgi:hypothetical protein
MPQLEGRELLWHFLQMREEFVGNCEQKSAIDVSEIDCANDEPICE